jgi:hypothetical protein
MRVSVMYDQPMPAGKDRDAPRPPKSLLRATVEIGFIIFLFYSNLLMGEFNRSAGHGKTLSAAFFDIFTPTNFSVGMVAALAGYGIVEFLRRKL